MVQEHLGRYLVSAGGRGVACAVSSKLRKNLEYPTASAGSLRQRVIAVRRIGSTSPLAVGDFVAFEEGGDGTGMIYQVLPRRNKLSRRAAGERRMEDVLIANVDLAVLVFSVRKPDIHLEMLDRFLALSELEGIPPLLCLNKTDLCSESDWRPLVDLYERIGCRAIPMSARLGTGVEAVRESLRGMVAVCLGPSGCGKTTLLNALQPGLGQKVGDISRASGRGRHTTTRSELFPTEGNGMIGDTPGLRELGLHDLDPGQLHWLFPEMRVSIGACRFRDCVHVDEPGCAVKSAVEAGKVAGSRYESYLRIRQRP